MKHGQASGQILAQRSRLHIIRAGIRYRKEIIQYVATPYGTAGHLIDKNRASDAQIRATITWPEKNKEVLGRFGHFIPEGTKFLALKKNGGTN
jgi:hypothetical protein